MAGWQPDLLGSLSHAWRRHDFENPAAGAAVGNTNHPIIDIAPNWAWSDADLLAVCIASLRIRPIGQEKYFRSMSCMTAGGRERVLPDWRFTSAFARSGLAA